MGLIFTPWTEVNRRENTRVQNSENSSRLAYSFGEFQTTGWGETVFTTRIDFGLAYIYKPTMSYGYDCSAREASLTASRFPRAGGFVTRWDIDTRGFYRGCWVGCWVEDKSPNITAVLPDPNYSLNHYFTFLGVAMKDIPAGLEPDVP